MAKVRVRGMQLGRARAFRPGASLTKIVSSLVRWPCTWPDPLVTNLKRSLGEAKLLMDKQNSFLSSVEFGKTHRPGRDPGRESGHLCRGGSQGLGFGK